jgi:hypothetical protein
MVLMVLLALLALLVLLLLLLLLAQPVSSTLPRCDNDVDTTNLSSDCGTSFLAGNHGGIARVVQ